ncbi:MAG: glycosyltransferase [Planctomycetales bacterium]|nr:glycosyltransferase [Planctomycetales bacterium]
MQIQGTTSTLWQTEPDTVPFVVSPPLTEQRNAAKLCNVLHIINGEYFSGAERVQQLLGRGLGPYGYNATFACVKPGKFPTFCNLRAGQVLQTPMRSRVDLKVVTELVAHVRSEQVKLLHAHTPRTALVASIVAARTRTPWIYHVHSPTARDSTRGFVNRINAAIESFSIRNCARLITVSRSLRREMLSRGVSRHKLSVVPNGVPAIDPIETSFREDCPTWQMGLVALMRPRKGVEVALDTWQILKDRQMPIQLRLIGGFENLAYQEQILAKIRNQGLSEHVVWTGFTDDVPTAIRELDGLLLPSLFGEGMPMVVLEALSAAVPVVATAVEGTPEVVRNGVEGILAEPGDPQSLALAIEQFISSRNRWVGMSKRALSRHREQFSAQRMCQRVARCYDRVLA